MFVRTRRGWVNLRYVREITERRDDQFGVYTAIDDEGRQHTLDYLPEGAAEGYRLVPATLPLELCEIAYLPKDSEDEEGYHVWKAPIVAWWVRFESPPIPVAIGMETGTQTTTNWLQFIALPNGEYQQVWAEGTCPSLDAAKAAVKAHAEEEEKRRLRAIERQKAKQA